jgi:hypothetical protein
VKKPKSSSPATPEEEAMQEAADEESQATEDAIGVMG